MVKGGASMKFEIFFSSLCVLSCGSLIANWTTPQQISSQQVQGGVGVFPVYDPGAQTLVAIWTSSTHSPVASVSTNHGTHWQAPVTISGATSIATPFAAFDTAHQKLVATWLSSGNVGFSAGSTDGGNSWGSLHSVSNNVLGDIYPLYDLGRNSLLATWSENTFHFPQAAISMDGGSTWSASVPITHSSTAIIVFTSYDSVTGNITATWSDFTNSIPMSSKSSDGGMTWSTAMQITNTMASSGVSCTYDPVHKTTVATWANASHQPVAAISLDDGNSWNSPITISSSITTNQDVFTSINPTSGMIIATWVDPNSGLPYYSSSQDGGNTWSTAQAIGTTSSAASPVLIAFDPVAGSFIATWEDSLGFPIYSIFTTPPPSGILTNQGGSIGKLASYLNSLAATSPGVLEPLLSLTPNQLNDALATIFSKPSIRFSAANTLLVMTDIFAQRSMEYATLKRLKNTAISTLFENKDHLLAYEGEVALLWPFQPTKKQKNAQQLPHGSAQTALHKKNTYALWAQGFGEFAHQDKNDQLPSFHTTTGGALAGFDYYGANGNLSTAFGYANSQMKSSMEHDEIDFYALSIYGIGYIGNGFLEAGIWGVYNQYDQNRHISFPGFNEHAKAKFNGWQYAPHLRGGYDFACGKHWILEPFVGTDCAFIFQDGFSEHGAAPYNIRQKHTSSELLQASSGLNIYSYSDQNWGAWMIRATLAYLYKKGFHFRQREALVGEPFGFSVIAYKTAQNLFAPGIEIFIKGNNGLFGAVDYKGQFGSMYESNSIFGKIGVFF